MNLRSGFSRRTMLMGGGLLLSGSALGLKSSQESISSLSASLRVGDRFVKVTGSKDPEFHERTNKLFPGLDGSAFQLIKPSTFLIQNVSGPVIKAFSVVWSITTPSSAYSFHSFFYRSSHPLKQLMSGQSQFLPKSESRLVSPFFNWSPSRFQQRKRPTIDNRLNVTAFHGFLAQEIRSATLVQMQLDAVIFSDWAAIGPDTKGLVNHFSIRRNAERDEALSLAPLMQTPSPDRNDILAFLRQHRSVKAIAGADVPRSDADKFWYYNARKLAAGTFRRRLKQNDTSVFQKDVLALGNKPFTKIHPLQP